MKKCFSLSLIEFSFCHVSNRVEILAFTLNLLIHSKSGQLLRFNSFQHVQNCYDGVTNTINFPTLSCFPQFKTWPISFHQLKECAKINILLMVVFCGYPSHLWHIKT